MCTAANGGHVLFSPLGEALETDYNPVANVVKKAAFRQQFQTCGNPRIAS